MLLCATAAIALTGYTCTAGPVPQDGTLPLPQESRSVSGDVTALALPPLPANWPASTLQLGLSDHPGGAATMKQTAPFGFRYQYLAGGVNTGSGWAHWNADGHFVTYYIQDSLANGIHPAFTYYMIYQSSPGNGQSEYDGVYANLNNTSTMAAYYNDLKLFFQRAGAFSQPVVLHVEPDMWGFIQQYSASDDATTVSVHVASTGMAELSGLPDNGRGLAQAIDRLRDLYAPNVILGYQLSVWGTGNDIVYTDPPDATVDQLATRAANFFNSLQSGFDVAFSEFSDRDSGFKQHVYGDGGASWWDEGDFARNRRFLSTFVELTGRRMVMWQIPLGNTKMRAMNNTWNHYQDNRPEWLLDDPSRAHLQEYIDAGVVAFLFGRGADGATCACDANGDGTTNPQPINGNNLTSLSADDDGGFFRQKAAAYYSTGVMSLGATATPTPTPTRTPTHTPTWTPTPTPTHRSSVPPNETVVPLAAAARPQVGGCFVFPQDNAWNTDISSYPVHPNSVNYIASINTHRTTLHPDFGSNPAYGIPYIVVPNNEPLVQINFTDYGDESDPGPYPIPLNAPIEGGSGATGDRHVIAVRQGECKLYELFHAWPQASRWDASSGAVFDLNSNALRPDGWTSADAAGLPILPGLVRYDEVVAGEINHALRFTVRDTRRGYIHPATHYASNSNDPNRPPMGLRLRLKASYDISGFTGQSRVIVEALKKYGMIVADNGSSWYITGATDGRWNDGDLNQIKTVPGSAFEVVYTGPALP